MCILHNSGGRGCPVSLGGSPSVSCRVFDHGVLHGSLVSCEIKITNWLPLSDMIFIIPLACVGYFMFVWWRSNSILEKKNSLAY